MTWQLASCALRGSYCHEAAPMLPRSGFKSNDYLAAKSLHEPLRLQTGDDGLFRTAVAQSGEILRATAERRYEEFGVVLAWQPRYCLRRHAALRDPGRIRKMTVAVNRTACNNDESADPTIIRGKMSEPGDSPPMSASKRRLGRGLDALLGSPARGAAVADAVAAPDNAALPAAELNVDALQPGRYQPRQTLSDDNLTELAHSIREQGVLQPLVVRPVANVSMPGVTHEIVAGERRWRAAQIAGLESVPVVVRELDDQSALAVALIENLQREDLNPIDQARSLSRLAREFGLTHQQVADAVGRSRSAVSNLLRLLDLNEDVKTMLANGSLDMGHARALLPLDVARQIKIARRAADGGWSVRQVEKAVRQRLDDESKKHRPAADSQTRWLQEQLVRELGGQVMLKPRADGSYKLDIGFTELGELQQALGRVQALVEQLRATAGPRLRDAAQK